MNEEWTCQVAHNAPPRAKYGDEGLDVCFQPGRDELFSVKDGLLVVGLASPCLGVSAWCEALLAGTDQRIVRFFLSGVTGSWCDADLTHIAFVGAVKDSAQSQCNWADDRVCCCCEITSVLSNKNPKVLEDVSLRFLLFLAPEQRINE